MKQFWKEAGIACLMGMLIPGFVLSIAVSFHKKPVQQITETAPPTAVPQTAAEQNQIAVLTADGSLMQMELEDYLTGVVLAEMPASFEAEAKKAQAVVARTYTIRAEQKGTKHEDAAVCTDSACCQGYISEKDYLAKGGTPEDIEKVRSAVQETAGYVLTYEGELIEATYFSCSGGSTEDAVAVWGTDVPYLQATKSPGEEEAAHYSDSVTFLKEDFAAALSLKLEGEPSSWFGLVTYTAGGGVDTMVIGGISFDGTALRKLLDLRSTAFTVSTTPDSITVTTRGYGHRVGMSQYGADAMAAAGSGYQEILSHYYQGTLLQQWND